MCYWGLLRRQYTVHLYTVSHSPETSSGDMTVNWSPPDPSGPKPLTHKNTKIEQDGQDLRKISPNRGVCLCLRVCVFVYACVRTVTVLVSGSGSGCMSLYVFVSDLVGTF